MPEKLVDVLLAENACPKCGAQPTQRCRTPSGKALTGVRLISMAHADRWRTMTPEQEARCTYSQEEQDAIARSLIANGVFKPL
jgi:hypothetical protein